MCPVVIIDDNKIAVEAIARSTDWRKCGCRLVGTAYDGIAGLKAIQELSPAIVIIDIQMPGFNGLDIIKKVKEEQKEIQFIIISGYSQFEYARQAIRYGVSDYLLKPIMTEEMEQALLHVTGAIKKKKLEAGMEPMDELETQLYAIRSGKPGYSSMVSQAIDYVDRNLQKNINLADVCGELLVSTGHFSKCFKRETGVGFAAYVSMVKMQNARILLRNPQNRVNEVARMLGYHDYAYFFQVFKKQFGYAPSDIKTNVKKDKEDKEHDRDARK
ncbi:response regulator transcription factor [Lacrimispora sp. 210928-DFI.3.58]|uniref:response regulator transcription factor n=1 Tax=Lacrimispora sp. 210928-DFI.3.58 TaxID=2883214 RepID=UPI0015B68972|nr:response regulator [Lacrimispora sp. 210928-DFI.3.58]MCB7320071.1 response regulator [Lacrimispora sp. 210928-DFI.3.58]